MPKQKTRKSVASRFKLTKSGKLLHRSQMGKHLKRKKSKSQKNRMKKLKETTGTFKSKLIKMIT